MIPRLFARRYLFSASARAVINLISGLSVAAVAMPVAAMIILLSVFNGFERLVKESCSIFDADLTVQPSVGQTFDPTRIDTAALNACPAVAAWSFSLEQQALLEHEGRQATVTLRGVDDRYATVSDIAEAVTLGEAAPHRGQIEQIIVGQALAWELSVRALVDSEVRCYALRRGTYSSLLPMAHYTTSQLPVAGIFVVNLESEQQYALISLAEAQRLFTHPDAVSSLHLRAAAGTTPEALRTAVAPILDEGFTLKTRYELKASFYRIMTYEKWGIFFIALMVLLVASFSVIGSLSMLIVDKREDIRTLYALGASTRLVRAIFRAEGLLICLLGAAIGLTAGVGMVLLQQHFGLIEIPAESFMTKSYPVEFRWGDFVAVMLSFGAVSLILTHLTVRSMIKEK